PAALDLALNAEWAGSVNMVEFRITEPARESEGILEIGRRMRVSCLEGNRFLVAEEGLRVLERLGIAYRVLSRFGASPAHAGIGRWNRLDLEAKSQPVV